MRVFSSNIHWTAATLTFIAFTAAPLATPKTVVGTVEEVVESVNAQVEKTAADAVATDDEPMVLGKVKAVTDENFERLVQVGTGATTGVWFIRFYAPWSLHCKKMEPVWNELAMRLGGQVNIGEVDAPKERALAERFGVESYPVFLLFSDGDIYRLFGNKKLDVLMTYAKGGYKTEEKIGVLKPRNIGGGVKEWIVQFSKDMKGMAEGKMPQLLSIVVALFTVLMVAVRTTCGKSQPATGKGSKAD